MKRLFMKLGKVGMLAAVLGIGAGFSAQNAEAFSFDYSYNGPVLVKYNNWEEYVPGYTAVPDTVAPGIGGVNYYANAPATPGTQDLYGILKVTSINPTNGGPTLWWDGKDGEEITGYFKDLTVTGGPFGTMLGDDVIYDIQFGAVTGTTPTIKLFLDSAQDFNPDGASAGFIDAPLIPTSSLNGISFVDIMFTPGIIAGDPVTLMNSSYTTITSPNSGTGFFKGSIVGGLYASMFAPSVSGQSNINVPDLNTNWNTASFDPIQATVVPEPSTVVLFGAGLVGLGLGYIRKRRNR